tara:strand:- start:250 stop:1911 length:1662 start_codon:yes stop_codon:yes gene_type:complete
MLSNVIEKYYLNSHSNDFHQIQIIVTNNSLLETQQWKIRTKNKLDKYDYVDVDILSSKTDSDYKYMSSFSEKIRLAENKNDLPNILIVCAHKVRVLRDITDLLKQYSGNTFVTTDQNIKFQICFDEPDSYVGVLGSFLKEIKYFQHIIDEILFVTATPYEGFWKILTNQKIHQLYNISKDSVQEKTYSDYYEDYMSVTKHNYLEYNCDTKNPLEYIINVFDNYLLVQNENKDIHFNPNERKIIFAPAHLHTKTLGVGCHEEIVDYFTTLNYIVFLSNGKFKGFIFPDGTRVLLSNFNKEHNIVGELRDTLRELNKLYPESNIAITGYWTIERGVTFNTDGFNFTDVIISNYHKGNLNRLIQLIGRCTGNKKYVNKMNIICPRELYNCVQEMVNKTKQLRELNPENYNRADFMNKDSAIPVKIKFLNEEFRKIVFGSITGKRGYKNGLERLLKTAINAQKDNSKVKYLEIFDRNNKTKLEDIIQNRKLNSVRIFREGNDKESRRFKQFSEAFDTFKPVAQAADKDQYNIDLTEILYEHEDFVNDVDTAWITYKL